MANQKKPAPRGARKTPLAKVVTVIAEGKTVRDTEEEIAKDIALLMHVRGNRSVSAAVKALEAKLGRNPSVSDITKALKEE